MFELETD